MLILFDLDRTLLDNEKLYTLLNPRFAAAFGLSPKKYQFFYRQYQKSLDHYTHFNPHHFISFLQKKLKKQDFSKILPLYFSSPEIYSSCLFPDVLPTLRKLKSKHLLGIFSQGYKKYQLSKLKNTGLLPFFSVNHIYVSPTKTKPTFLKKLFPAVMVDNDKEVVDTLLPFSHLKPIWLNRLSCKKHPIAPTIHTLTGLSSILG